jgi:acyl-CoA thioester hydrolase
MRHQFRLRVYYEDTDAGGIVYHANYLKFAERARTEALIELGLSQIDLRDREGLLFVVRAITVDFFAPARLEDLLVVTTTVERLGGVRIMMRQDIRRDEGLLASCAVTLAGVSPDGKAVRIPDAVRKRLARLGPAGEGVAP